MKNSTSSLSMRDLLSIFKALGQGAFGGLLLLIGAVVGVVMLYLTYYMFQMSFRYRDYSIPIGLTLVVLAVLTVMYIVKHWTYIVNQWRRSTLANFSKHYKRGKLGTVINMEQFMSPPRLPVNPFAGRKYQPFYDAVVGRVKGSTTRKTSLTEKRAKARTLNKFPYND